MALTSTLYATTATNITTGTGLTWTNPQNATGSTSGTIATWTNSVSGAVSTLELSGYNFSSLVPAGSTINSVTCTVASYVSNTNNIATLQARLYAGATALGAGGTTLTKSSTSSNTQTISFAAVTTAQLADLRVRFTATRAANTTSAIARLDWISLAVDYTAPAPTPGAAPSTLTDTFATLDATKWIVPSNASIVNNQLNMSLSATYQQLRALNKYNLTGSGFYVEVVQRPNVGNGTTGMSFGLALTDTVNLYMTLEGTSLLYRYTVSGTFTGVGSVTYDPVAHRWWRMTESGGNISWWVSPNGTTWNQLGSPVASPATVVAATPFLDVGHYGAETAPGIAIWDNFNTVPAVVANTVRYRSAGSWVAAKSRLGTGWAGVAKRRSGGAWL